MLGIEAMLTTEPHTCNTHERTYSDALVCMQQRIDLPWAVNAPLFVTDADNLWETFLASIDADQRQHYTCHACRHFIHRYGSLAYVDAVDGRLYSALWSIGGEYQHGLSRAFAAMAKAVKRAKIVTVFRTSTNVLGEAQTGAWSHFSVRVSDRHVHRSPLTTAAQAMAEKREEYAMLSRSFGDFSHATVQRAYDLLKSGQLYRSEKCEGVARWLLDLYEDRRTAPQGQQQNRTWLAVAAAPVGYCHVRSGMIGTLLTDVQDGLPFADIKRRFDEKMNPLQYLRPQAPPSAGNIAQAERVVATLQSAGALARRFARLDEVEAFWRPRAASSERDDTGGVFGHLRQQVRKQFDALPPVTMTWVKFRDKVLADAVKVEYCPPSGPQPYCAIVTAVNPAAPPLMQWDSEERRNPASWYLYSNGSYPRTWNLAPERWVTVDAFTLRPSNWYGRGLAKDGEGVIAILHGARDTGYTASGGFFPENLRAEYHAVRRTLEAYAKTMTIEGRDEATACGLMLTNQSGFRSARFRVTTTSGTVAAYTIDRWD